MSHRANLNFSDLVLVRVSGSFPLVLSANDLFQVISMSDRTYRHALSMGRRWASGEFKASPLPRLNEVSPASVRPPTTRRREEPI
jgi:hypothetical protein